MTEAASAVPCPRETWRAAVDGRRITITVQSDPQASDPRVGERAGSSGWTISGDITDRRKVGDAHEVVVSVTFVPDGELAPVELEAVKDGGEWTEFRAFSYQHRAGFHGEMDGAFRYIGTVSRLEIPGGRWGADESEVVA